MYLMTKVVPMKMTIKKQAVAVRMKKVIFIKDSIEICQSTQMTRKKTIHQCTRCRIRRQHASPSDGSTLYAFPEARPCSEVPFIQ